MTGKRGKDRIMESLADSGQTLVFVLMATGIPQIVERSRVLSGVLVRSREK